MLRLWKVLSLLVFQVCPLTRTILNPTSIGTHAKKCLLLLCTFGYFVTDIFSRIHLNSTSSCVTTWPRVEVKVPIPILHSVHLQVRWIEKLFHYSLWLEEKTIEKPASSSWFAHWFVWMNESDALQVRVVSGFRPLHCQISSHCFIFTARCRQVKLVHFIKKESRWRLNPFSFKSPRLRSQSQSGAEKKSTIIFLGIVKNDGRLWPPHAHRRVSEILRTDC